MTKTSGFIEVGYVRDAHGIKGEIFVRLNAGQADWLNGLKSVRLCSNKGEIKTYSIGQFRLHKNGIIFKLEGLLDRNAAEALKGFKFEIAESLLVAQPGDGIYLYEILGFDVLDKKLGSLGPIKKFSSNGLQDLLVLERGGKEILVPFVKPFIDQVDFNKHQVEMTLPEGLIDAL